MSLKKLYVSFIYCNIYHHLWSALNDYQISIILPSFVFKLKVLDLIIRSVDGF
jgi:hypothetical protein